jgi:diguanylate cyclase (GGDEF)-like protein
MVEKVLYESDRTRVSRIRLGGSRTAIRKESLGLDAAQRTRRELNFLSSLTNVPGVPRLLRDPGRQSTILMEDVDGQCLSARLQGETLDPDDVLGLAVELVATIAAIHRHGIVHQDINPGNILLHGSPQRPMLIDFDLAARPATEPARTEEPSEIVGSLAYMAPEQTGRTGWPVDQRADLYALGATLYELATGRPPFTGDDPLQLTHDHLTSTPIPPVTRNRTIPSALSDVIMRLLAKEPRHRYQSAEGVLHDLRRIISDRALGHEVVFDLGERDFPSRLVSPTRLVGRDGDLAVLSETFRQVVTGSRRGVFVSGQPGVGKSVLVDELRPLVIADGGWFMVTKFDQYRTNASSDAIRQLLRALALMLLTEPDPQLAALRAQLRPALGINTSLVVAAEPLLELALGEVAGSTETGDPAALQPRLLAAGLDLLRVVASPERPVVLLADDVQWADPASIAFIDSILTAERLRGMLLVCAYRDSDIDESHRLSPYLHRWRRLSPPVTHLRLENLPPVDLRVLLADMLRLSPTEVRTLADFLGERTAGNPFSAVEMVNALRRENVLTLSEDGWRWDPERLHHYIDAGDVISRLATRIAALPARAREVLEIVSCLGGRVELDQLRFACSTVTGSEPGEDIERWLKPALEDGLLVMEHEPMESVRFRHDWIQQAAFRGMSASTRNNRHLALARRLSSMPEYAVVAAEQYLPVVSLVNDPIERREIVRLLRAGASHAALIADYRLVDRYLSLASQLLPPGSPDQETRRSRVALDVGRHAALYALGQFEQVDLLYQRIREQCDDPLVRAEAAWVQISGLTNRGEPQAGLNLGIEVLAELGHPVPAPEALQYEVERGIDSLRTWLVETDVTTDLSRPPRDDPVGTAIGRIINRMLPASYFCRSDVFPWLIIEAYREWATDGPDKALVGPLAFAASMTIPLWNDYTTGRDVVRRVLRVAEARDYEPDTSEARFMYTVTIGPWFEPLEENVRQGRLARENLVRGGDVQFACFSYYTTATQLFDCASTLEEALAEIEAGITFANDSGNGFLAASMVAYRQGVRSLRGETNSLGGPNDDSFDEATYLASLPDNPTATAFYHIMRAMVAAVFGDQAVLRRNVAATRPMDGLIASLHCRTTATVMRALDLVAAMRPAPGSQPPDRVGLAVDSVARELGECREWLAERAVAMPGTFLHLRWFIDAEYSWANGDVQGAFHAFDQAQREVAAQRRPWQRALIAERLARFHLEQGIEYAGRTALREARRCYQDWGASGKVALLDQEFPFLQATSELRVSADPFHAATVSSDNVDMLAVLRASQALSSETNLARLRERVTEVLCALTGATTVHMLVWRPETGDWRMTQPEDEIPLTAAANLIPVSVFRYVERTRMPLVVDDAVRDDRFSRDPYLRNLRTCSLMAVPILTRGKPQAILILENRDSQAVFGVNRLDAVQLIAGQLSVSLENALLYTDLERKVAARTEALKKVNAQLELLVVTDPLTGLANRRRLTEILELEWRSSLFKQMPIGMAMIDIDHFKLYNDHYGHLAGDSCLKKVAATIGKNIRDADLLSRYGGEEFAIVLPRAHSSVTRAIADRVRIAVADLAEPHARSAAGIVTISIGVASTVPRATKTPEHLIKLADLELYRAKAAGRNRVSGGDGYQNSHQPDR